VQTQGELVLPLNVRTAAGWLTGTSEQQPRSNKHWRKAKAGLQMRACLAETHFRKSLARTTHQGPTTRVLQQSSACYNENKPFLELQAFVRFFKITFWWPGGGGVAHGMAGSTRRPSQ